LVAHHTPSKFVSESCIGEKETNLYFAELRRDDRLPKKEKKESTENRITSDFCKWFSGSSRNAVLIPEYETPDGKKVDLAVSEWQESSEFGIECWAADSKNVLTPKSLFGHLTQMQNYGKYFPKIYILTRNAKDRDLLEKTGELHRIGIFEVISPSDVREICKARVHLFNEDGCLRTRALGILHLLFAKEFPEVNDSTYNSWGVFTNGLIQFSSFIDDLTPYSCLAVNVENVDAAGLIDKMDTNFHNIVKSLPESSWIRIWKSFRLGARRQLLLVSCHPQDFELQAIRNLLNNKTKNEPFHLRLSLPLWPKYELLGMSSFEKKFKLARKQLDPLFNHLAPASE
jgi:hypothetical protein